MMGIGMAVRPPRQLSLMARALSAIRRNGGTLIGIPDNFAGAYIESNGTPPVTAVGDPVGLLTDRSYGAGNLGGERKQDFVTGVGGTAAAATYNTSTGAGSATRVDLANQSFVRITGLTAAKSYRISLVNTGAVAVNIRQLDCAGSTVATISVGASWDGIFTGNANCVITSAGGAATFTLNTFREVLGNHATQPTTASKPLVTRIPKRLGPNLVVNGTFDTDVSGWTASFGVATHSGGKLRVTSTGSASAPRAHQNFTTVLGTTYALSVDLTATTSQAVAYVGLSGGFVTSQIIPPVTPTGTARAYGTFTATGTTTSAILLASSTTSGNFAEFDNISVQEVLEWTNAISFDGSNDFLQTSIATGNEGWICAGVQFGGAAGANETIAESGAPAVTTNRGIWLFRWGQAGANWLEMRVGNGTAVTAKELSTTPLLGVPRVAEGGWDASNVYVGVDGVLASKARTGDASPSGTVLRFGGYQGTSNFLQGPMTAIIYTPVLPSAADRALIRKWVGSLQGQTL